MVRISGKDLVRIFGTRTTQKMLLKLIDPGLSATTKWASERDAAVSMANRWVAGIDNFETLPRDMSNFLCAAITGSSYQVRKLYSDQEMLSIELQRPLLLTGISPSLESDMADRCITIPHAPAFQYQTLGDLEPQFALASPYILGALLSGVSQGLRGIQRGSKQSVRMADFAAFARAAGQGMGWWQPEDFEAAYAESRADSDLLVRGSDQHQSLLRALKGIVDVHGEWKGSATRLLGELQRKHGLHVPPSANRLAALLNQLGGQMQGFGFQASRKCDGRGMNVWTLTPAFSERDQVSEVAHFGYAPDDDEFRSASGPSQADVHGAL